MTNDTVMVIGIHAPELAFGDRVAALLRHGGVDVLRIPHGIPQPRTAPAERFLSRTQHHEIYLQLHQQVRGRYRLMVDLHRGVDERGTSADVISGDESLLARLRQRLRRQRPAHETRLVHIRAPGSDRGVPPGESVSDVEALTWIPPRVWQCDMPIYVGLEIYLRADSEGSEADCGFALGLIRDIRECARSATA